MQDARAVLLRIPSALIKRKKPCGLVVVDRDLLPVRAVPVGRAHIERLIRRSGDSGSKASRAEFELVNSIRVRFGFLKCFGALSMLPFRFDDPVSRPAVPWGHNDVLGGLPAEGLRQQGVVAAEFPLRYTLPLPSIWRDCECPSRGRQGHSECKGRSGIRCQLPSKLSEKNPRLIFTCQEGVIA